MATAPTPLRASAHHEYQSWTCTWRDETGHRRTKRFGKVNEVPRKVATARYHQWLANEWQMRADVRSPGNANIITVTGLCRSYFEYADETYRKRGKATSTMIEVKATMEALIEKFGTQAADSLGAPDIARFRDAMIFSRRKHPKKRLDSRPLSISTINGRLRIIKRCFGWARQYDMVSRNTALDIQLVKALRAGRSKALEAEIVSPVPEEILAATIAGAPKTVADMIRVQVLTGMRPGELCDMRACDIDRSKDVWIYRPESHKTEHHGKKRVIPIGPKCQAILEAYLPHRNPADVIFTPEDAHRERLERAGFPEWTAYQMSRSTFKPGRKYNNNTYRNAIQRECDRLWDRGGKRREAGDYGHRWHPHQLRHNAATAIRQSMGMEAASDVLGHSTMSMTARYAESTLARLEEIARKVG